MEWTDNWTKSNLVNYKEFDHPIIREIYREAKIPKVFPDARLEYLIGFLGLDFPEEEFVRGISLVEDIDIALNYLEKMAVERVLYC